MNYANYSVKDFLEDNAFRQWVQVPSDRLNAFWEQFLMDYPQKAVEVAQARQVLLALDVQVTAGFTPVERQEHVLQQIKSRMHEEATVRRMPVWPYWSVAAAVLLLLGLWLVYKPHRKSFSYESNVAEARQRLIEKVNTGDTPMSILLNDGSRISLAPDSRLSFTENFNAGGKREVYLSGEAFFDVARNPGRPFFVYSNELVTKVLGTSFHVKAYDSDEDVVVNVTSGKVSVSVADDVPPSRHTLGKVRNLLLLPNQQAVLMRKEAGLVRSVVKDPVLVKGNALPKQFVFAKTPVTEVFETLKAAYAVPIVYDAAFFTRCELTADLSAESLYEKLDVICKSIEATYKSDDGQIVVTGSGCN